MLNDNVTGIPKIHAILAFVYRHILAVFKSSRILLFILALTLPLTSCTTKITYRFLDILVAWEIDNYIDLDANQKREVDKRLDALLLWHQKTQLPLYSDWLRQFKKDISGEISREIVLLRFDEAQNLMDQSSIKFLPDGVFLLATLTPDQIDSLQEKSLKKIHKDDKKYLKKGHEKYMADRIKSTENMFKGFIGPLNKHQKSSLKEWNDTLIDTHVLWIENRKKWLSAFVEILNKRKDIDFSQQLEQLLLHPDSLHSEEYKEVLATNTDHIADLFVMMQPLLTEKQKKRFFKEIDSLIIDFDELSVEPVTNKKEK